MFLVDSHCHLDQLDLSMYDGDLAKALAFAKTQGVQQMLCVCITLTDFSKMMEVIAPFDNVHASVGIHPTEEIITDEPSVQDLVDLANNPKIIAIGETGLDYFRSEGNLDWQRQRFRHHIRAAKAIKKPLIIHSRQAREDTIAILKEEQADEVGGVMHCFTEDLAMAERAMELGFYISISGIVTFNSAKELQYVAQSIPLDKMLIETDAPYLAPVPHRGKSNQPAYVRYVAEFIAKLRDVSVEEIAEQTTKNYFKLFKLVQ